MASIPHVASALQHVLTAVPEQHARDSGFCRRRSKLSAAAFVQAVVLGWLAAPRGTLSQLSQRAASAGAAVSPQALDQRFGSAAAELLERVAAAALAEMVDGARVERGLLARFPAVEVLDATTVRLPDALADDWPGCGGGRRDGTPTPGMAAALKLSVRLDLVRGTLAVALGPGKEQDKASPLQRAPLPPGGLRIADLGYWSLDVFAAVAAGGAYFLSRLSLTTNVYDATGAPLDLAPWLAGQRRRRLDVPVRLGADARLPARLLAVRVPARVAARRRAAIHAAARKAGTPPSPEALALAAWTLLVTNAPPDVVGVPDALVLARARWQIELLFKLWKDGGLLDEWRTADPARIRCEVWAKLTGLVIQHWVVLAGCWDRPDRSLTQAARTVRDHAVALLLVIGVRTRLRAVLAVVCASLAAGCRVASRRSKPSLFQLLADPSCGGLA